MSEGKRLRRLVVGIAAAGLVVAAWHVLSRDRARDPALAPRATPRSDGASPAWSPSSPDRAPAGSLRLDGQVRGLDDAAIVGAEVWIEAGSRRATRSEDDGTFVFEGLVEGTHRLGARHHGWLGGPVWVRVSEHTEPVVIRIGEGASVVVTVVGPDEQPVAGVDVTSGDLAAKTDEQGQARLAPLAPGWIDVFAIAAGYVPATGSAIVDAPGATGHVEIALQTGFAVSGRVVDDRAAGVAGARLFSVAAFDDTDREPRASAISDAQGRFVIPAVAPGPLTLVAVHDQHAPGTSGLIAVDFGPVTGIEIAMRSGGVAAGTVVDGDGRPVPNASVRVASLEGEPGALTRRVATNARGEFEIAGLARTRLHARAEAAVGTSRPVEIDLREARDARDVSLVLRTTRAIAGIVVDEQGVPVPEASVHATSKDGPTVGASATADVGGRFTIAGLPDGEYALTATRTAAPDVLAPATSTNAGDEDVRITLPTPGGIRGTVAIDGEASPPSRFLVELHAPSDVFLQIPSRHGAFELASLRPGSYKVTISGPDFADEVRAGVAVEAGKVTDLGAIVVRRGRKIVGKVVDDRGQPVARATVAFGMGPFLDHELNGQARGIRSAITDASGAFAISGAPARSPIETLGAAHPTRGRSAAVRIPDGAGDPPPVTLVLRGVGSIAGTITRAGKPVVGAIIGAGDPEIVATISDEAGAFVITNLPAGPIRITVMRLFADPLPRFLRSVDVVAGQRTRAAIEMEEVPAMAPLGH